MGVDITTLDDEVTKVWPAESVVVITVKKVDVDGARVVVGESLVVLSPLPLPSLVVDVADVAVVVVGALVSAVDVVGPGLVVVEVEVGRVVVALVVDSRVEVEVACWVVDVDDGASVVVELASVVVAGFSGFADVRPPSPMVVESSCLLTS